MHRRNFLMTMNLAVAGRAFAANSSECRGAAATDANSRTRTIGSAPVSHGPRRRGASSRETRPTFLDYVSVEAQSLGEPVYGLDYMMYIYGVGPDLMPDIVMQEGKKQEPSDQASTEEVLGDQAQPLGFEYRAGSANAIERQPSYAADPFNRRRSEYSLVQLRLTRPRCSSGVDPHRFAHRSQCRFREIGVQQ